MQNRKAVNQRRWSQSVLTTGKLADETSSGELHSLLRPASLISSLAPKPPKKRFLEAAAAHQHLQHKTVVEDNSALMQLAEMCVLYEKPLISQSVSETYTSYITGHGIKPLPRVSVPVWSWARQQEDENEEPLDLSGEQTIRASQQDLINHLVEKLCSKPDTKVYEPSSVQIVSSSSSSPSVVSPSASDLSSTTESCSNSSWASNATDMKLPLKKRDLTSLCDSTVDLGPSIEPVTSTSHIKLPASPLKPAQRSCKGKRYLEFMFEGRIPLGHRVKRLQLQNSENPSKRGRRRKSQLEVPLPKPGIERRQTRARKSAVQN